MKGMYTAQNVQRQNLILKLLSIGWVSHRYDATTTLHDLTTKFNKMKKIPPSLYTRKCDYRRVGYFLPFKMSYVSVWFTIDNSDAR